MSNSTSFFFDFSLVLLAIDDASNAQLFIVDGCDNEEKVNNDILLSIRCNRNSQVKIKNSVKMILQR